MFENGGGPFGRGRGETDQVLADHADVGRSATRPGPVNLREHVVLGGGAALALTPVLGAQDSAVFWAASVLIDADHYWDYLYRSRFRDWSPRRMFEFHRTLFPQIRRPDFLALSLFHTVEWFALVYLVAAFLESSAVEAVFWGMAFHLALDALWLTLHRALFSRAFSMGLPHRSHRP